MNAVKIAGYVAIRILSLAFCANAAKLQYSIKPDGSYSFSAGKNPEFVLTSGETYLQANRQFHTTANGSLKLISYKSVSGNDVTGTYTGTVFSYSADIYTRMESHVLVYNEGEFVRFIQSFPDGVLNANVSSNDSSISGFPSFLVGNQVGTRMAGYISLYGDMCGRNYSIGNISSGAKMIRGGERAGPVVLFDAAENAMVLSAFSNFMAHNTVYNTSTGQLHFGIMGGVASVPLRYQIDTILYYGSDGINRAIAGWGRVLTTRYGKTRDKMANDLTIKYVGYWTDHGAYYYYNTITNKTYEDTIVEVLKYGEDSAGVPYRYVQYDSWWYYKGIENGVKNWTAMPSIFPNGSEYLYQKHGLPVAAQNRYWAANTDYARANGGTYDFYTERSKAIPFASQFWDDLFRNATKWGLVMYVQDWLEDQFVDMQITHQSLILGRDWLIQMGRAADEHDITIQYGGALPRHMLQSVEIPAVTQARVSEDYTPGTDQWKIGVTSMFVNALNLAPFKDTFWSFRHQEGSPYTTDESYPQLQAVVATLSTGPFGPADKIGSTDGSMIMQCCREDGLILKPTRPITTTDGHILGLALPGKASGSSNKEAEVFSTFTDLYYLSSLMRHGILLVTDLTTPNFKIYPNDMYLDVVGQNPTFVAYRSHPVDDPTLYKFNASTPLTIPTCGRSDFELWYVAPVISVGNGTLVAILGERGKWVPVSKQRIKNIYLDGNNLYVDLEGIPSEFITFGYMVNYQARFITCNFPPSGVLRMDLASGVCLYA